MGNDNSIDLDMPFDTNKMIAESLYERCDVNEVILPKQFKTTADSLIVNVTCMKE